MNADQCRLRLGNGAENFSRLRRIAMNKLKNWNPRKPSGAPLNIGIKIKQQMCGWNNDCLLKLLLP